MFYGMFVLGVAAIIFGNFWFRLYQKTTNPKADSGYIVQNLPLERNVLRYVCIRCSSNYLW
ncbi:hypothetical protein EDM29_15820 [Staphylococcus aureus]|nr:hypothetical protein EDM29_15820 [Staphylococcus aureus]